MARFGFTGRVFKNPTDVDGGGGTELKGLRGRRIVLDTGQDVIELSEPDRAQTIRNPNPRALVVMPLSDNAAAAVKEILAALTADGLLIVPDGTGRGVGLMEIMPSWSILVVPSDPAQAYLYVPYAQVAKDSQREITYDEELPTFPNDCKFLCSLPAGDAHRPFMRGSKAQLITEYALGAGA